MGSRRETGGLVKPPLAATDVPAASSGLLERPATIVERHVAAEARRGIRSSARPATACTERGTEPPRSARAGGARGTVLGLVHPEGASLQVPAVHQADRLLRRLFVLELHEGEPSRAPGLAVRGHLRIHDLPGSAKRLDELLAGDVEAQIAHEHLVRNGPFSS